MESLLVCRFISFASLGIVLQLNPAAARLYRAPFIRLGDEAVRRIAVQSDIDMFMGPILRPLLQVRVPGTAGSAAVRNYISRFLRERHASWHVDIDRFVSSTPYGWRQFNNIVATLDERAPRRLVVACHYDSKYFRRGKFVGATDSAVPCAMILDLAKAFDHLLAQRQVASNVTLQLIFFDGEEAFKEWSATDSLYGSRHLAAKMQSRPHPHREHRHMTEIDAIETFLLLDLIGARQPVFLDYFSATSYLYKELQVIERRLEAQNLVVGRKSASYFPGSPWRRGTQIEDDHIPFLRRGVPILHLIANPFPHVWHTLRDTKSQLDVSTIDNVKRILQVFVAEYLRLPV